MPSQPPALMRLINNATGTHIATWHAIHAGGTMRAALRVPHLATANGLLCQGTHLLTRGCVAAWGCAQEAARVLSGAAAGTGAARAAAPGGAERCSSGRDTGVVEPGSCDPRATSSTAGAAARDGLLLGLQPPDAELASGATMQLPARGMQRVQPFVSSCTLRCYHSSSCCSSNGGSSSGSSPPTDVATQVLGHKGIACTWRSSTCHAAAGGH